jgi:hypothetical protein
MSHDNRIYVNTTQNNLVVIDGEQNQLTVTHPITQVIEITQAPRPTVIVTEETPNNVSVTEAVGNTVIVSATGPQGIKGDRGSDPELTALELFTGSIQTQVNNLAAVTASYVLNSVTASMLQPYVLTAVTSSMTVLSSSYAVTSSYIRNAVSSSYSVTASRLEGTFRLTTTANAAAQTISALGGLAFNNLGAVDIDGTGTLYVKTTTTDVSGLATRLMISGSGQVGIGRSSASFSLHTAGTFGLGTGGGAAAGASAALSYDGANLFTFRNSGGDNGLNVQTNITQTNIQAVIRPNVNSTTNGGFSLASSGITDANSNHLVIASSSNGTPRIGIGTFSPLNGISLTVSGGALINGTSNYFTDLTTYPVQLLAGSTSNAIGINSNIVAQYGYGTVSPYYQFGWNGSQSWRVTTTNTSSFSIQSVQPTLSTPLFISASGYVGIGTSTPLSNLHVYKGLSGAEPLGLTDGITLTLENDTTNYINFRSPNTVVAGLAFSTPADNSAGYISLQQSTGEMFFSTERSTGYHTFRTADIERLRIANTTTTVRNNLIVSGATSQFTASGTSLFNGEVDIFGTNSLLNISGSTVGGVTISVSSSLEAGNQPALLISQIGTGSAITVTGSGHVNLGYSKDYQTGGRLNILGSTYMGGQVYLSGTTVAIQNGTAGRALINFGTIGNSYLNNGNLGLGTTNPTQRLDVVGSASFAGNVTISNVLTLTPQHPLPSVNLSIGSFAVSASTPPKPHFWDGISWNALY